MWPVWLVISAAVVALSFWRRSDVSPAVLVFAGLIGTRIASNALPVELYLIACAALWVGIGGLIVAKHAAPVAGSLLLFSGLCYLWARVTAAPIAIGSAPFVVSDVLGALALVFVAWGAWHGGVGSRFLGRFVDRRNHRPHHGVASVSAQKGA